jgi:hypothetical protein
MPVGGIFCTEFLLRFQHLVGRIPYSTEQGIFAREQGIFRADQGS